jgi:hypothetical protein
MPVTFFPAPHRQVEAYQQWPKPGKAATTASFLQELRPADRDDLDEFLQSSLPASPQEGSPRLVPKANGFVHTVIDAYNGHHALVLRPDDVWLCILTQFSLFVNGPGRAEALRSVFVAHEGKRELVVIAPGDRYTVDFGNMATTMTNLIQENVVDPKLRAWIIPDFGTTIQNDVVAASVVMMATFRAYFAYKFVLRCGIPSVTLLGERSDWEGVLVRIEKLREYGAECQAWYGLLQPVIRRFVLAFDADYGSSEENRDFWQRVAHFSGGGSGPTFLSGWITAFCVFDNEGHWVGPALVCFLNLFVKVALLSLLCFNHIRLCRLNHRPIALPQSAGQGDLSQEEGTHHSRTLWF